jgi:hypothetical protein
LNHPVRSTGIYSAWAKVGGKLIRRSLETGRFFKIVFCPASLLPPPQC